MITYDNVGIDNNIYLDRAEFSSTFFLCMPPDFFIIVYGLLENFYRHIRYNYNFGSGYEV